METESYCAYNVSLGLLLSGHVREMSGELEPLQFLALLLNGPGLNRQSALWLRLAGHPREWPRLFAFDFAYLDDDQSILESGSVGPGSEFPALNEQAASVLFLPDGRLSETGSTRGNVIRICAKAELAALFEPASYSSSGPGEVHLQAQTPQNQLDASPSSDRPVHSGFAFEPFGGSLVYLPDPVGPSPQTSEFFLTREGVGKPFSETARQVRETQVPEESIADTLPPESSEAEEIQEELAGASIQLPPTLHEFIYETDEELSEELSHESAAGSEPAVQAAPEFLELSTIPEPPPDLPVDAEELQPSIADEEIARIEPEKEEEEEEVVSFIEEIEEAPAAPAVAEESTELGDAETLRRKSRANRKDILPIGRRLQRWITRTSVLSKRRSTRIAVPGLVAFYWTGGAPKPHEIVNISKGGFYLRTQDIWLPDTLVRMTLEKPRSDRGGQKESIGILARVVRIDKDGVGHEFVTTEDLRRIRTQHVLPEQGTSKKELEAFLARQ